MGNEINIKKIFGLLKKRLWIIILTAVLFSSLAGVYSVYYTKPLYESSSRLIVKADPTLMNTLLIMIKEPSFLEKVVSELGLNKTPEELSQQISSEDVGGSSIVKITAVDENPKLAAEIANATASVFKSEVPSLLKFKDIIIFSGAKPDPYPINDNHQKKILLGLLAGVIAGVGIIFLQDFFDNTVKSERNLEEILELPVLGIVSKMNKKNTLLKKSENVQLQARGESLGTTK
ncbi:YveK family protein [Neobacillus cucumis]|uniref:Capsular biosynthesis protein n=1 Tax=Neobacillus cucumis TaxID=1740721 RepID=A0A2N5HQP6_9BACI|nr:Wzz/FepE/Etk N-terminal domain-containing protein [Neobacillus cucumis]PLS07832.1 capsular biosynthesis protein [Neobacillus cucumis]